MKTKQALTLALRLTVTLLFICVWRYNKQIAAYINKEEADHFNIYNPKLKLCFIAILPHNVLVLTS